jgi:hypothetical protein
MFTEVLQETRALGEGERGFNGVVASERVKRRGRIRVTPSAQEAEKASLFETNSLLREYRLRERKKNKFEPYKDDWTGESAPDFIRVGHVLGEKLKGKIAGQERVEGYVFRGLGFQDILSEATCALAPHLEEVVSSTKAYREQLSAKLREKGVPDADNLGDAIFRKAIMSGDILNYYEDLRANYVEDYLTILTISQSVRLASVGIVKDWADREKIKNSELDLLSMSVEELSLMMDFEQTSGPIFNAVFNKLLYQQAVLGNKMPGEWGRKIYNGDTLLGKLFIHTWQNRGSNHPRKLRSVDFISPEWGMAADSFKEFVVKAKNTLSASDWEKNWEGVHEYFKQLDVVMRSRTFDRARIDGEYDKLMNIALAISPRVRILMIPPLMEDSKLAVDGLFRLTWQTDGDRARVDEYQKLRSVYQKTIDRVEELRPGLIVHDGDLKATVGQVTTLFSVSGQASESPLQGGRHWRGLAMTHEEVVDRRTLQYRWPFLVKMGLAREDDLVLKRNLLEAMRYYTMAHEMAHGVMPDPRRSCYEELKADLFGLHAVIEYMGGVDKIKPELREALILAVVSEDLYNLSASSVELGSLGLLYAVPAILRVDRMIKDGYVKISEKGFKVKTKGRLGKELLVMLTEKWGKGEVMEDGYLWARVNNVEPSDKTLLRKINGILKRNKNLRLFVQTRLPALLREIDING